MAQGNVTQHTGHNYTTNATALKYRTKNSGNPLAHDDVDANFEILRGAVNGLVSDHSTQSSQISALDTRLTTEEGLQQTTGTVAASAFSGMQGNASAITALDTRVTTLEGLQSTTGTVAASAFSGMQANASAISALQTATAPGGSNHFVLGVASATVLGGVKEGGDIDIDNMGVMSIKSGSITSTMISNTVNLSGDWLDIKRWKVGFVGNKYATSGYTIDGGDSDFDGVADSGTGTPPTIDGGIGHGATAMDGGLTTGKWMFVIYYPGNTSHWYTRTGGNGAGNLSLQKKLWFTGNSMVIPYNSLHNNSYVTQNPPCHDTSAGYGGHRFINYIYGNGQSFCITNSPSTTWVRCRSDGLIDLHLRTGNSANWSYMVLTGFKYE